MPGSGGWNRNEHYHPLLLRAVPRPCGRALDVGCGLGSFSRKLAAVAAHVDAIDREPAAVEAARARSAGVANVHFSDADFLAWHPRESYDFLAMIAVLHHLPFAAALRKVEQLLKPGGTFAVIGLDRQSFFEAAALATVAWPIGGYYRLTRRIADVGAPLQDPEMTLAEIRREAGEALAGVVIRRLVLFRYSLVWTKPRSAGTTTPG